MLVCMSAYYMPVQRLCGSEEDLKSHRAGVTDGCEPPPMCWGPHPCHLQEEQMLLTESGYFQPQDKYLKGPLRLCSFSKMTVVSSPLARTSVSSTVTSFQLGSELRHSVSCASGGRRGSWAPNPSCEQSHEGITGAGLWWSQVTLKQVTEPQRWQCCFQVNKPTGLTTTSLSAFLTTYS